MVKFNASVLNRLKITVFLKHIHEHNVSFNKTLTTLVTILTKCFFFDQVYSNTRVPTQLNTSQHESIRVNTSPTRINTSQHESDTNQHDSTRAQHESTRVQNKSTQVNKSKKVKKSPRRVNASQLKSDMSLA